MMKDAVLPEGKFTLYLFGETYFLADVGSSPKNLDTIDITIDDIQSVINE